MSNVIRITGIFAGIAGAAALSACDVQIHDATAAEYTANHDVGMYEIKATVTRDALVSPGSVFLFGLSGDQKIELTPDRDGSGWHGYYSIRCHSSFPLQFRAVWKVQGLTTKQKLEPVPARQIKLNEPEPTREASIDTSGSVKSPKGGWPGAVTYRFATAADTRITAARIEPVSQDPADIAAAKAISIVSTFPVDAGCGTPTQIELASSAQRARANLVIDTDLPAWPHWQTKVEFVPK